MSVLAAFALGYVALCVVYCEAYPADSWSKFFCFMIPLVTLAVVGCPADVGIFLGCGLGVVLVSRLPENRSEP